MRYIYQIIIRLYELSIKIASFFNSKAHKLVLGRNNWELNLSEKIIKNEKYCWIHCASAGEFEQAIPLINEIKNKHNYFKIAVSFFSPSGFEMYQDSGLADVFFYFPLDTRQNAENLIKILNPDLCIFIRNEIWWNMLTVLKEKNISTYLVNANSDQKRNILYQYYLDRTYPLFTKIFDTKTFGNTKLDKVIENKNTIFSDDSLEDFCRDSFVIILGSSWQTEEKIAANFYKKNRDEILNLKMIIAPHEFDATKLNELETLFSEEVISYSQYSVPDNSHSVLFLDKKGILKYVYRYADIAFIGGGFDKTVHNVSEAAVYGIPTIFGPNYQNFEDANIFVELHIAFDGADEYKTENLLKQVSIYDERRIIAANKLNSYFSNREKTSERIISEILK